MIKEYNDILDSYYIKSQIINEIQIIPSTTNWTGENVIITVLWPTEEQRLDKEISIDGGITFNIYSEPVVVDENNQIVARIKYLDKILKTATLTINNIDKTIPIITTDDSELILEYNDNTDISTYFTFSENGPAPIMEVIYEDSCHDNVQINNTSALEVGVHTIKAIATKVTGLNAALDKTIIKKPDYTKAEYTTPGTYTFTVPAGITKLKLTVAGAGGGSASGTYGTPRSRGGYGGYYEGTMEVIGGETYEVVVGAGGYRGYYYGSCNSGRAGGSSKFGSIIAAGGGGATTSNVSGADGATNVPGVYGGKGYSSGDYGAYGDPGWVYVEYGTGI